MRLAWSVVVLLAVAACSSGSDASPAPQPAAPAPPPPSAAPALAVPTPPPAPPPAPAAAPIAPNVALTPGGAASDARHQRLLGDGFAIEIPLGFSRVPHATAGVAWAGNVRGVMGDTIRIQVYAAVEPAADLQAYTDARAAAITAAGGTARVVDANLFGFRPGVPNRPSKRIVATTTEHRTTTHIAVVDGRAYSVSCEAPRAAVAEADCPSIVASLQLL